MRLGAAALALAALALAASACGSGTPGGATNGAGPTATMPTLTQSTAAATIVAPPAPKPARRAKRPPELHLPHRLPMGSLTVPILMYHRVRAPRWTDAYPGLSVPPKDFAAQMRWLVARGYHSITQRQLFAALVHHRRLPRRPVMITFDDGYVDVLRRAAPIMHRLGLVGTVYVISDRATGSDPTFLRPGQLRRLQRLGIETGSHTVDHKDLGILPDAAVRAELVDSRRTLERIVHQPVQWLAYPSGAYDPRVERIARQAGYVLAVTTVEGDRQRRSQPLALQRIRVSNATGPDGLGVSLPG